MKKDLNDGEILTLKASVFSYCNRFGMSNDFRRAIADLKFTAVELENIIKNFQRLKK